MTARRWFSLLLRAFPRAFRDRHGEDMRAAFDSAWADHHTESGPARAAFLARTTLDVCVSGARERMRPAPGGLRRPSGAGPGRDAGSWLDVKLGVRMLVKHPGLTLVSTLALGIGIPVGLAPAHFVDGIMAPLPVPEGERIRSLRLWSPQLARAEATSQMDFEAWRPALSTFEELGAFRETRHNVAIREEGGTPVRGAAVTASTFELLRVRPQMGRVIQTGDETPGAPDVVVIGHDLWTSRFAADPAIVGRQLRLGGVPHTVVGVMPGGFLFPERQHVWTPLQIGAAATPDQALRVSIFGRLADGVSDQGAREEFASVARSSAPPDRDPRLETQVEAYAYALLPGLNGGLRATPEFLAFQTLALMVLFVACVNVGMLVFARTAARAGELAVRTALGASRARIVAQVFIECLVLAVLASGVGMLLMGAAPDLAWRIVPARVAAVLPYWIDWSVDGWTVLRALALAALSAVLAGVLPALRFTGRGVQSNIRRATARRSGVRFGGLSGVLIVLDVAVAVAAVGFAATVWGQVREAGRATNVVGIPAEEFLAATITLRPDASVVGPAGTDDVTRSASIQEELVRRLRAEPRVQSVAVANVLPRMEHPIRLVEAEGVEPPEGRRGVSSRVAMIDLDFFEALDQPIVSGRGFDADDLRAERSTVIVNRTFVENVLGGQNPIGRRIRFAPWGDGAPGPWKEIVGVVGHLGMRVISEEGDQGVYEPFAPGELASVNLGIRLGDDPASFAPRLRAVVGELDPEAVVSVIGTLDEVYEGDWYLMLAATLGGGLLVGVLLALAASGIYAIMSFAVSERTVEIGIRSALGADRPALVRSVVTRAIVQLGLGVVFGMPFAAGFFNTVESSPWAGAARTLAVGVAVMLLVGLAACTGPTLRALRIHPSEALRSDG